MVVVVFAIGVVVVARLAGQKNLIGHPRFVAGVQVVQCRDGPREQLLAPVRIACQLRLKVFSDHVQALVKLASNLRRLGIQGSRLFHGLAVLVRVASSQHHQGQHQSTTERASKYGMYVSTSCLKITMLQESSNGSILQAAALGHVLASPMGDSATPAGWSTKPFHAPQVSKASIAYRLHVGSCLQLDPMPRAQEKLVTTHQGHQQVLHQGRRSRAITSDKNTAPPHTNSC